VSLTHHTAHYAATATVFCAEKSCRRTKRVHSALIFYLVLRAPHPKREIMRGAVRESECLLWQQVDFLVVCVRRPLFSSASLALQPSHPLDTNSFCADRPKAFPGPGAARDQTKYQFITPAACLHTNYHGSSPKSQTPSSSSGRRAYYIQAGKCDVSLQHQYYLFSGVGTATYFHSFFLSLSHSLLVT
jgi:hypothetical protein